MKNLITLFIATLALSITCSANTHTGKVDHAAVLERVLRKTGGHITKPDSAQGTIAFLNAQTAVPADNIAKVADSLHAELGFNFEVRNVAAASPSELFGAAKVEFAVIIVSDDSTPAMLVAPDDHWAVVNVEKLKRNLKSNNALAKFHVARVRKEILRAFSLLCGGGASQYKGNLVNAYGIEDMDLYDEKMPVDMLMRYTDHLKKNGLKPIIKSTYRKACREGWAPAPTNDIQKAIWDEVHTIPDKPLKIEYDPAAQKGKVTK